MCLEKFPFYFLWHILHSQGYCRCTVQLTTYRIADHFLQLIQFDCIALNLPGPCAGWLRNFYKYLDKVLDALFLMLGISASSQNVSHLLSYITEIY